jgi:Zn-dependent M28 family amino/carboxypeptidase
VEAIADQEPARNRFIRSDQYSFIRQGVPALAFKFGFAPGSPEQQTMKDWLRERYHAPSDDLTQPVDKEGAARFNRILVDLLAEIANAPDRPRWKDGSFFKRFAR